VLPQGGRASFALPLGKFFWDQNVLLLDLVLELTGRENQGGMEWPFGMFSRLRTGSDLHFLMLQLVRLVENED